MSKCLYCYDEIPEGMMVCPTCENKLTSEANMSKFIKPKTIFIAGKEYEINPCKRCGCEGVFKSTTNGNVAVFCTNENCKNHIRGEHIFKCSHIMALNNWNKINKLK